jgi:hypothetical protein
VFLLERHFFDLAGEPLSAMAVLGVTSLTARQAGPERLAAFVRDVTLGEDRCRVRTGAPPSILAVMRSHAIGALRLLRPPTYRPRSHDVRMRSALTGSPSIRNTRSSPT